MKEGGGDRKDGQGSRQEARPGRGVRGGSRPPLLLVITELLFKCQRPSLCASVHKGGGIYADAAQYVAVISTSAGVTSENKILLLCRALIAFLHQFVLYGKAGGVCYNVRVRARVCECARVGVPLILRSQRRDFSPFGRKQTRGASNRRYKFL